MKAVNRSKVNIATNLLNQIVAAVCGIVVQHLIISGFGSEAYGITVSIAQFLSYITLLEGGIGGVARASLYGPLARKDVQEVSAVYQAEKSFFRYVAVIFLAYSVIVGLFFHSVAHVSLYSGTYIFFLVIVISIATLAKYAGGLPNLTLIMADQRHYVNNFIMIATTIVNAFLVLVLVNRGDDLLWVKFGSSLIFAVRPILYSIYVRRHYTLQKTKKASLEQKWTGIGQHIAFFLHTNMDVVLLTVLADVKLVAVYAVYNMVIGNIRVITQSFSGSMEGRFGELIAKNSINELQSTYRKYAVLLSAVTVALFGCTAILIVPFVRLYTQGISDANYIQPVFAFILILAEAVNCLALPFASLPIAANQLRQTRWGAYGEAIVNLAVSLALVWWNPLVGVVTGTLAATLFRAAYYMAYSAKNILHIRVRTVIGSFSFVLTILIMVSVAGASLINRIELTSYFRWTVCAAAVFAVLAVPAVLLVRSGTRSDLKNNDKKEDDETVRG